MLRPDFSGHPLVAKPPEYTYTAKKSDFILGSLSKAFSALQNLHSYLFLPPGKQITAASQHVLEWPRCPRDKQQGLERKRQSMDTAVSK